MIAFDNSLAHVLHKVCIGCGGLTVKEHLNVMCLHGRHCLIQPWLSFTIFMVHKKPDSNRESTCAFLASAILLGYN